MGAGEKMPESVAGDAAAQPNNGLHPTRTSADVIRQLGGLFSCVRAGDAWR